jgi:hypothetical protein
MTYLDEDTNRRRQKVRREGYRVHHYVSAAKRLPLDAPDADVDAAVGAALAAIRRYRAVRAAQGDPFGRIDD